MPSYPPRSQPFRKQEILQKREREMQHAIRHDLPEEKLLKAAARIREARLKLYKGILEQFRYKKVADSENPGARAQREMALWESMELQDVIEHYRRETSPQDEV